MSKEKLEVGDVWLLGKTSKIYILSVEVECSVAIERKSTRLGEIYYTLENWYNDFILGNGKYLGKSKANINDLFEMQDD